MEKDNYKNEILDYLNQNKSGKHEIFDVDESEYSHFENTLIQSVSTIIDELIQKMSEGRGITPNIHVFCVNNSVFFGDLLLLHLSAFFVRVRLTHSSNSSLSGSIVSPEAIPLLVTSLTRIK